MMRVFLLFISLGFYVFAGIGHADSYRQYQDALRDLRQNDYDSYRVKKARLQDNLMYPYLEYHEITQVFNLDDEDEVQAFLKRYPDTNIARKLKIRWINLLGKNQRWRDILEIQGDRQTCLSLLAKFHLNETPSVAVLERLWLDAPSHQGDCEKLFKHWHKTLGIRDEIIWQRFADAMHHRQIAHAKALTAYMHPDLKSKADLFFRVYYRPASVKTINFNDTVYSRDIIINGLRRLASRNPASAAAFLEKISDRYQFTDEQRYLVYSRAAARLATRQKLSAEKWFKKIPVDKMDPTLRDWYMRSAIAHKMWPALIKRYDQLPETDKQRPVWRFWKAYALHKLDRQNEALGIFDSLLKERNYYALLTSHLLNRPLNLHHQIPDYTADELREVEVDANIQRAKLFYDNKQYYLARSEWNYALSDFTDKQKYLAAVLADRWGWHANAIHTLSDLPEQDDDLNIRFPLAHSDKIHQVAKRTKLNPATLFAISRLESTFKANARSHAGAMGIMQLMPNTAKRYRKQLKLKQVTQKELFNVPTNLLIGGTHYSALLKTLKGDAVASIAAYNAGLHNVKRWLRMRSTKDTLIWIELIPFYETRQYVKRIIIYSAIYHQHLNKPFDLSKFIKSF